MTRRILKCIAAKNAKNYPPETILVIQCVPEIPILNDEWERAIQKVREGIVHHRFQEIFVFEPYLTATL